MIEETKIFQWKLAVLVVCQREDVKFEVKHGIITQNQDIRSCHSELDSLSIKQA